MSIVWHIFKKDARLMRGPLAIWIGVQLATFALALFFSGLEVRNTLQEGTLIGVHMLFVAVVWASAYLFAAIPLHDDPASGGQGFWVTRPVSRSQLLGAKLLGVLIFFCGLPILLRVPWWLGHAFNGREFGWAVVETLLLPLYTAPFAFVLASLTANSHQFYRGTLATAIAVPAGFILAMVTIHYGRMPSMDSVQGTLVVLMPLLGGAMGLLAILQFLFPDRIRTGVLFGILLVAGVILTVTGNLQYVPTQQVTLQARFAPASGEDRSILIRHKDAKPGTIAAFETGRLSQEEWTAGVRFPGQIEQVLAAAFGTTGSDTERPVSPMIYTFRGPRAENAPVIFVATGILWRIESIIDVPLVQGAEGRDGSRFLRIDELVLGESGDVNPQRARGRLVIREVRPDLLYDETISQGMSLGNLSRWEGNGEFYVLVTKTARTRILPDFSSREISSSEVVMRSLRFPFNPTALVAEGQSAVLKDARLVKLAVRKLGTFQTRVEMQPAEAVPSTSAGAP